MFNTMKKALDSPKSKNPTQEEINKIQPFIFLKWLSGSPYTIQAANTLNMYYDIPIENQFNLIKTAFGGKIKYIPYPKNVKVNSDKITEYLCLHFKINPNLVPEYLELIDKKELDSIVEMYQAEELR